MQAQLTFVLPPGNPQLTPLHFSNCTLFCLCGYDGFNWDLGVCGWDVWGCGVFQAESKERD